MFASGSVQASFGRLLGAFPVEAANGAFRPSPLGQAANGVATVACVAAAAACPWMLDETFKGVRQFTGGIHWALLVAAVSSLLAVACGLLWALKHRRATAQLFTVYLLLIGHQSFSYGFITFNFFFTFTREIITIYFHIKNVKNLSTKN
jgi:hypothetical protein